MASEDDSDVPETGAVFTFGKSQFADNIPNKFWIRDDQVIQVCCGDEHTALVAGSGRVFTFGANEWGQLGLGHDKQIKKPTKIKALKHEKITQVACGRSHTLLLTEFGKLYSCGANGEGQLGLGHTDYVNKPALVESLSEQKYSKLSAGAEHSAILTEDGVLYVWGSNSEGQLGLGDEQEAWQPVCLKLDEKVISVSCGYYHTALITESGHLYTFGETEDGKLGLGHDPEEHRTPQKVDDIPDRVIHVSCGGKHTAAVTNSGRLYTFGDGTNGQLGHDTSLLSCDKPVLVRFDKKSTKIKKSSCGESHTAVITVKGQLFTFGDGRHGKLALGEENFANQFKPTLADRFMHFIVEDVSCGGCHMLISAKPRMENGNAGSQEEEEDEECSSDEDYLNRADLNGTVCNSIDLNGTLSARNRRREKLPDPGDTIKRNLPPLDGTLSINKQLSPLNKALPTMGNNHLNQSRLPALGMEKESFKKKSDESEESASEDEKQAIQKLSSHGTKASPPTPKPRVTPRKSDVGKDTHEKDTSQGEHDKTEPESERKEESAKDQNSIDEENEKNEEIGERKMADGQEDGKKEDQTSDIEELEKDDISEVIKDDEQKGDGEKGDTSGNDESTAKEKTSEAIDSIDDKEEKNAEETDDDMADGFDDGSKKSPEEEDTSVIKAEASEENKSIPVPAQRWKSQQLPPSGEDKNKDDSSKKDSEIESGSETDEPKKEKKPKKKAKKAIRKEAKTQFFGRRKIVDTDSEEEMHKESDEGSSSRESGKRKHKKAKAKNQVKKEPKREDSEDNVSEEEEQVMAKNKKKKGKKTKKKVRQLSEDSKKSEEESSEKSDEDRKILKSKAKDVKKQPQKKAKKLSDSGESGDEKKSLERKQSKSEQESSQEESKQKQKKNKVVGKKSEEVHASESEGATKHQMGQKNKQQTNSSVTSAGNRFAEVDSKTFMATKNSSRTSVSVNHGDLVSLKEALSLHNDKKVKSSDGETKKNEKKEEEKPQEKKKSKTCTVL